MRANGESRSHRASRYVFIAAVQQPAQPPGQLPHGYGTAHTARCTAVACQHNRPIAGLHACFAVITVISDDDDDDETELLPSRRRTAAQQHASPQEVDLTHDEPGEQLLHDRNSTQQLCGCRQQSLDTQLSSLVRSFGCGLRQQCPGACWQLIMSQATGCL